MQFSDLHIHSKYSDGVLWPEQIVEMAFKKGLKHISITDHDTIESQYIINRTSQHDVDIIPGVEISSEYDGREIHILGYFIDIHNSELEKTLEKVKLSRLDRAKEIIFKLNKMDIDITFEEINKNGGSIGRPHIAKALVNKGLATTPKEAFHKYLIKGRPAYADRYKIHYKDALSLIKKCNGVSALAHPGEIYKGINLDTIIKEFKVYGLNAVEVFHPSHNTKQTSDYYNLAKKYSLGITGGSDCHGLIFDNDYLLGTIGLDENLMKRFLRLRSNI